MRRNFRLNIILRILLLTIFITLAVYFLLVEKHYLRSVYLLLFIAITIIEFIYYVDRTNRDFTSFLLALLQGDFTTTFSTTGKGKSFNKLYDAFNKITRRFKQISTVKQAQHIYLETLVEHVKVGIISFDQNEKVHLMNHTVKHMLNKETLLYLKGLSSVSEELLRTLREIKPGDQRLIKLSVRDELLQLAIHAATFKQLDDTYKIISIQNIKNELETNELVAWQKLIRVLTHEIMNSVTPISSLTDTLKQMTVKELESGNHKEGIMPKLVEGLEAIKSRSDGLQAFTQAYRKLTKIPPPNFDKVYLLDSVKKIETLLADDLKTVDFKVSTDKNIEILADKSLLEQVLINLIKNAIQALENTPDGIIRLTLEKNGKVEISISDNGPGIEPDKMDKIFIPFFTTKKDGSGIGLALSREIIRLHNGSLNATSIPGEGTSFIIKI